MAAVISIEDLELLEVGGINEYRIRCGNSRVIYSVEDRKVLVIGIRIAHRKDMYR